jgi:hypothetical protein
VAPEVIDPQTRVDPLARETEGAKPVLADIYLIASEAVLEKTSGAATGAPGGTST